MRSDMPEDPTGGNGDWREEWRRLLADDQLRTVEDELDAAEIRILEELATEAPPPRVRSQSPPAPPDEPGPEPVPGWHPSFDGADDPLAAVAIAIINQGLTIPLGHGSVRLLEDRVMFGVALPLEDARALARAWAELSNADGDGSPATESEVAIATLLASLLDPLTMRMLGDDEDGPPED